jgi:diadenylate cyclase
MRLARENERDCVELGAEGRLIRMQLEELVAEVPSERAALVLDYHASDTAAGRETLERLAELPYHDLLELDRLAELLGYPRSVNPLDHAVSPRGFRVLSHIPRLPDAVIKRVVRELDGLESIVRATQRDLEAVEGVGSVRAREIREGLRRLQEHNLVERYLQV